MRQGRPGRNGAGRGKASRRGPLRRNEEGEVFSLSRERRVRPGGRAGARRRGASGRPAPRRSVGPRRLQVVALVVALVGLVLGGRAAYLSVVQFEDFEALAAESVTASAIEKRGDILSADGRELATSLQASRVVATPYQIEDPDQVASRLAEEFGGSGPGIQEIEESLTARDDEGDLRGYSVIAEAVDPRVASEIEGFGIAGISTEPDAVREYPHEALASQLIGYLGDYKEAFGGVEAGYNENLAAGQDVNLTVDAAVQQQLQESLDDAVEDYDAEGGVGIVLRVDDGEILGMANSPVYDNNEFAEAPVEEQRNRIITDPYEPGSTFKAFTMAAALEEGSVSPDQSFSVPDSIDVSGIKVSDSHEHPTENMTSRKILQESSNVGTIQVAQELGGKALNEYIERFGFGEPTGIELAGEAAGSVLPYADWSGASIGNIPIGQGISVTPLQLATGYAALANGGFEVEPYVAEQAASGGAGDRVISGGTSDIVRGMLQSVVDEGTGGYAQIPGYSVAGKTGTSEKIDPKTGTYGGGYVTSFVGFAPASDPEYLTLIVVDEPEGSMWGERVAAPAFQEVMSFTLGYFNVVPDRPGFEAPRLATSPERYDEDGLPGDPDAADPDSATARAAMRAAEEDAASEAERDAGGGAE